MSLAIPELPRSVRASMLLNGSNADFVINAYLALQRQWPDVGGYGHYLYVLGQPGQPPTEELAWDCGEQLRASLVDQHGREKRRRRL